MASVIATPFRLQLRYGVGYATVNISYWPPVFCFHLCVVWLPFKRTEDVYDIEGLNRTEMVRCHLPKNGANHYVLWSTTY